MSIGSIIGIGSALLGASAAKKSAKTQASAAKSAQQAQLEMYRQTRQDQLPWLQTGAGAVGQLGYLMGVNPVNMPATPYFGGTGTAGTTAAAQPPVNTAMGAFGSLARPFGLSDFQTDPGYDFRMSEGMKALERSAAARGGLLSGAGMKAIQGYGQNLASEEFQNAYNRYNQNQSNLYNRLAGLSGTGQTSAGTLANVGAETAGRIGGYITDAGAARAAGQVGATNAWLSGLGTIGSNIQNYGGYGNYNPDGTYKASNIVWER